jgi:3-hydroxyisobutyrate dehydrogenase-like beta-hydroxyacid dehydrogenase
MSNFVRLAWVGLGKLGLPMAAQIVLSGRDIAGFDIDPGRAEAAASQQVRVQPSLEAALDGADIVFTSLPDDVALDRVGAAILKLLPREAAIVETSTVSAEASASLAAAAEAAGVQYLRAPVSGNPVLAERGELTVLASGPLEVFEAARPAMTAFSRAQHFLGPAEEARYAKLAINLMIAVSAGMMGEALTLARKGGVDRAQMLDLLADSAVGSPMVRYKAPPLKAENYASTFSCRQMAKDLDLILAAARGADAPTPLAAQIRETYSALIAAGEGDADFIATVRHAARQAGFAEG